MKKKLIFVVLAMLLSCSFLFAACSDPLPPSSNVNADYPWSHRDQYADSSDLPDWTQSHLKLDAWNTSSMTKKAVSNNIIYDELDRVTGVRLNDDIVTTSTDNTAAGYTMLSLAGELPHIAYGGPEIVDLIDPDKVWDLTEYTEYIPNIMRRMPEEVWDQAVVNGNEDGKIYSIPYYAGSMSPSKIDKDCTEEDKLNLVPFDYKTESYGYFYIREDILKSMAGTEFVDADVKDTEDIEALYKKNGKFEKDDLFDVHIKSYEEFFKFCYDVADTIKNNNFQDNAKKSVKVISSFSGSDRDTWDLLGKFFPMLLGAPGELNSIFGYWDAVDDDVKLMLYEDFFKDLLDRWADEIDKGVITDNYGTTQTYTQVVQTMNNGGYAIVYGNLYPSGYQVTVNGETHKYRRVYMEIPMNEHFVQLEQAVPATNVVVLFKDTVRESDIPQILQYLDYQQSEIGEAMLSWGPRSAGLWELNAEGEKVFKDKDIEDNMVYNRAKLNDKVAALNLSNGTAEPYLPVFPFQYKNLGKIHPAVVYERSGDDTFLIDSYFTSYAITPRDSALVARVPSMHRISPADLPGIDDVWGKRPQVEDALKQCLLSYSKGSAFTAMYNELVRILRQSGWTEQYFENTVSPWFKEANAAYLEDLENWTDSLASEA